MGAALIFIMPVSHESVKGFKQFLALHITD
jgi:hypothetical protein